MRRNLAIALLACATVFTFAACSSSTDTSTGGGTSTTAKGGGTATTAKPAASEADCSAVKKFLFAVISAEKPENQGKDKDGKDKGAETVKSLDAAAKTLKTQFPAKEAPDTRLRNDADAMLKYLKPLATNPNPPPVQADKDSSDKAKDDMNKYKGMNCKDDTPATPTTKAGGATTTAKK